MKKWLDKYEQGGLVLKQKTKDNYGVRENPNDVETYVPPGFVGMGNDISGRNYSPAWGGQFAMGGSVPGSVGFTYARTINPAPSEGPYAKKTMPSAQNGQELLPKDFTLQYINSPKYKERITRSGYDDPNADIANRYNAVNSSDTVYLPSVEGSNTLTPNMVMVDKRDATATGSTIPDIEAHEYGHEETTVPGLNEYDYKNILKRQRLRKIDKQDREHDTDPFENKADLNAIKYELHNKGVDIFNKDITPKDMKLLNDSKAFSVKRAKNIFGDKNLLWLLNNIAENQQAPSPDDVPTAQNGQEMKFYQEGLDWKPRTISQNGSIFPKENIDAKEVYNRINPGLSYWQLPIAQAMGDMVNKPRTVDNQATPEEEAYWKKYLHLPTSIPNSSYRLPEDEAKGNEYVGMFPSMEKRIQAIADTLNTGKIYRNYDKYKAQHPNLISKSNIEDAYKFGKELLNNPNQWQQADEDLTVKGTSRKTTGLGALQDFGMMWDKPHNKINVHDTYDFPIATRPLIPGRTNDLQIRDAIDFDPTKGSWMLRNNLQNYNNVDKKEDGGWLDNFKDGGDITKDDDGYWNPDNWGKPVEIGSNDITMQGVNQPLLGISDTGDTQYMVPGKDYKFKGKKVREYPVAQNGLRQEQKSLQNLDNLTNFTNYNTPQKGGWLQKYFK